MPDPVVVDARGLLCPMPVIRTQDAIAALPANAVVQVLATDPGVHADLPAWCRVHGHVLERIEESGDADGSIHLWIRVNRPQPGDAG